MHSVSLGYSCCFPSLITYDTLSGSLYTPVNVCDSARASTVNESLLKCTELGKFPKKGSAITKEGWELYIEENLHYSLVGLRQVLRSRMTFGGIPLCVLLFRYSYVL